MNQSPTPYRSLMAWPAFILCTAHVCFSLWVAIYQTPPQRFLARNGLVFLGLSMLAGTTANLLQPPSRAKRWLALLVWVCLAASFAGVYLRAH